MMKNGVSAVSVSRLSNSTPAGMGVTYRKSSGLGDFGLLEVAGAKLVAKLVERLVDVEAVLGRGEHPAGLVLGAERIHGRRVEGLLVDEVGLVDEEDEGDGPDDLLEGFRPLVDRGDGLGPRPVADDKGAFGTLVVDGVEPRVLLLAEDVPDQEREANFGGLAAGGL